MNEETENPPVEETEPAPAPNDDPQALLAQAEAEIAELKDSALRALAETENLRKRNERLVQEARTYAIDRFARDLLPVADSLARALAAAPPEMRETADQAIRTLIEGVALTEQALSEAFGRHNVTTLGAKGDKFDPTLHQAVAQIPSDSPAGTIAEVFQPGYRLGDRTLRAAMVAISAGDAASPPDDGPKVDIKV